MAPRERMLKRLVLGTEMEMETGTAVLLVSEELEELLSLSDRIAVIYGGEIMGTVKTDEADVNELGLMMTGSRLEHLRAFEAKEAAKTAVQTGGTDA